jgi:hypothetical protein
LKFEQAFEEFMHIQIAAETERLEKGIGHAETEFLRLFGTLSLDILSIFTRNGKFATLRNLRKITHLRSPKGQKR